MLAKLYLEITNECDLACPFCPESRREPASMRLEDFEIYLRRIEGRVEELHLHVKGEPLLHPALGDMLEAAARSRLPVSLVTNGTRLAERASLLLGARGLRKLSVSLHSRVGLPGLERYWREVEAFLDLHRLRPAFPVSLRLWNRGAAGLPPETARIWGLLEARYPGAGDWKDSSDRWKSRRLDEKVYLNQAEEFRWPGLGLPALASRGTCHGIRDQVAVLVDGTVAPCCLDGEGAVPLGNLRESSLETILEAPRARAMRDGFAHRVLVEELCRTCGYRERFG